MMALHPSGRSTQRKAPRDFRLLIGCNERVEGAADLVAGARRYAEAKGWKWTALGMLPLAEIARLGDGVVAGFYSGHGLETRALRIPLVSVHPDPPPIGAGQVCSDERAAMTLVVDSLSQRGVKQIYLVENLDPYPGPYTMRGPLLRETLQARGCYGGDFPHGPRTQAHGWNMVRQLEDLGDWLLGLPRGSGILATDDNHAKRVLRGAQLRGVAIPDEFLVMGMGNHIEDCLSVNPSISSLAYDNERIGYAAAAMVDKMRRGEVPTVLRVPPKGIVLRESSTPWETRHPALRRVLRVMRDHVDAALTIDDMAKLANTNRTTLFQWFKKELNTTPHQKLKAYRLEKGCELLRSTPLPLKEIPERCGYLHLSHFCRDFKAYTGKTPKAYRGDEAESARALRC